MNNSEEVDQLSTAPNNEPMPLTPDPPGGSTNGHTPALETENIPPTDQETRELRPSFETNDSDSDLNVDTEDYVNAFRSTPMTRSSSRFQPRKLWNNVKYWWWHQNNRSQRRQFFKSNRNHDSELNARGIPLYDLDTNGDPISDDEANYEFDDEFRIDDYPMSKRYTSKNFLQKFIPIAILVSLLIYLLVKIIHHPLMTNLNGSSRIKYLDKKRLKKFDPYIKYNNGTMDFYPITLVLSISGFHPSLISLKNTPFLHGLYSLDLKDFFNITMSPFMIPSFPTEPLSNYYSIVTGKYPSNHGIFANSLDHLFDTATSGTTAELSGDADVINKKKIPKVAGDSSRRPNFDVNNDTIWSLIPNAYENNDSFKVAMNNWPILNDYNDTFTLPYYYEENDLISIESNDPDDKNKNKKESKKKNKNRKKQDVDLDDILDDIVSNFDMDDIDERPQLIMEVIDDLMEYVKLNGYLIGDEEFDSLLGNIDYLIEQIFEKLQDRNLLEFTNVLLLSENGIRDVPISNTKSNNNNNNDDDDDDDDDATLGNVIIWDDILNKNKQKLISHVVHDEQSSIFRVFVKNNENINEIYHDLKMFFNYTAIPHGINNSHNETTNLLQQDDAKKTSNKREHFNIYLNGNFPRSYKFNHIFSYDELDNKEMTDSIWILPDPGYSIMAKERYGNLVKLKKKNNKKKGKKKTSSIYEKNKMNIGLYGYDNEDIDMRSLFIGVGPSFNNGSIIPVFHNIEVFNIICEICGVSNKEMIEFSHNGVNADLNFIYDHIFSDELPKEKQESNTKDNVKEDDNDTASMILNNPGFIRVKNDDFLYLANRFGNYSTYNVLWGGYPEYVEDIMEDDVEDGEEQSDDDDEVDEEDQSDEYDNEINAEYSSSTTSSTSSSRSSSSSSSSFTRSTRTVMKSKAMTNSRKTSTSSSLTTTKGKTKTKITTTTTAAPLLDIGKEWFNELIHDGKELFDDGRELIQSVVGEIEDQF
ncbi:nucleotide diphosphatase/phosphodiesterase NPP1 NDAI_0G04920 [Naumovozyma dairenensis CBS 421]|uniref:Uncharacterized protein n=1 Tax=Naumovozyma dairenensis (strain ATCC 10597 / BCRC 20456 / CBS 421 / NBRC 0211 / NRRL Y-12639) TaxID=1071378 RepID=J7SBQ4_NAUDC|nr:hypothetical protein NDAI_0G04920 [Naumovozyma dairenensis CBS 421]CCK73475.1 hypothetical protein NDAI_0G04920 [Naumovozyma dairenensis CBS 421]